MFKRLDLDIEALLNEPDLPKIENNLIGYPLINSRLAFMHDALKIHLKNLVNTYGKDFVKEQCEEFFKEA